MTDDEMRRAIHELGHKVVAVVDGLNEVRDAQAMETACYQMVLAAQMKMGDRVDDLAKSTTDDINKLVTLAAVTNDRLRLVLWLAGAPAAVIMLVGLITIAWQVASILRDHHATLAVLGFH